MDKNEFRLKTEQMLEYMSQKAYKEAKDIADMLDWRKVKNTSLLCTVSEIYEYNEEFEKSREILFLAYDRAPDSKKIIYRLAILALKNDEIKEAMDCYKEFVALAPKDPNQYILKYKILKAKQAPLTEQIEVLEQFKQIEYVEKWSFELAKLYHEAGMASESIEECDDLILWFSEGKYVKRAMELKMTYKPLTPLQQEKYNLMTQPEPVAEPEVVVPEPVVEPEVEEVPEFVVEPEVEVEVVPEPVAEPEVPLVFGDDVIVVEEVSSEETEIPEVEKAPKSLSIEEMLQEWEAKQKENAELIREKVEQIELEKAELAAEMEKEAVEEDEDFFLPDDIRQLMEELESESEVIEAKKAEKPAPEPVKEKPQQLIKKVVEKFATMELPVLDLPTIEDLPEEEPGISQAVTQIVEEQIQNPVPEVVEEAGLRIGDTQSMAAVAKALKNNVEAPVVEEPVEKVPERASKKYDTGFIVKGRYDLEAQSEVGLKAGLTEEQKKLFSYFVPVHGMSEQLVEVLQSDKKCKSRYGTSRIGNLLIIGRKGSGKTVLAVDVVKAIQKARKLKQGKMGIVTADSLNKKDVFEIAEKLHGGAIIIEKASKLNRRSIEDLCDVMEGQTGEMLVVLEDERRPLEEMLEAYPQFSKKFTSRLELPVFINDELVTFGQTYAKENGYKIDEMGILALYSRIDMLQREERVVTVADVKDILDEAIENAHRSSLKKVMQKLLKKNRDEDDRVVLKEEDFR